MKIEVIGVTNVAENIAKMLGAESENDYGLYQETQKGKYYARILPDGTFQEKVVRLISDEQATKLEATAVASVEEACKNIQKIVSSAPVIDLVRFNKKMEDIQRQTKAKAEEMGKNLKNSIKRAGFNPVCN